MGVCRISWDPRASGHRVSLPATISSLLVGSPCLDGPSFQAVVYYGLAMGVGKMLALCSAQADVVCAVGVGGQEEDPPLLGW